MKLWRGVWNTLSPFSIFNVKNPIVEWTLKLQTLVDASFSRTGTPKRKIPILVWMFSRKQKFPKRNQDTFRSRLWIHFHICGLFLDLKICFMHYVECRRCMRELSNLNELLSPIFIYRCTRWFSICRVRSAARGEIWVFPIAYVLQSANSGPGRHFAFS